MKDKKEYEKAKSFFETTLSIYPEHGSALRNMGVVLGLMGDEDKGYDYLIRSYKKNKDDFRTLLALTSAELHLKKYNNAIYSLEKLLKLPLPPDIYEKAKELKKNIFNYLVESEDNSNSLI